MSIVTFLRRRGVFLFAAALALGALIPMSAGASNERVKFDLSIANPKLGQCLAEYPDDPKRPPTAEVTVDRGELNDTLHLRLKRFKPGLNFDMFTFHSSGKSKNLFDQVRTMPSALFEQIEPFQ